MYQVDQWTGVACNCINKHHCGRLYTVLSSFLAAPPLTLENVMSVVKGVSRWRTLAKHLVRGYDKDDDENKKYYGSTDLDALQHEHGSDEDCLKAVVSKFLQGKGQYRPESWRGVIWSLYEANEIQLADQIQSYGERLTGVCLCMYMYVNIIL